MPSSYEKQAHILQTWVTLNNLLCFLLPRSPLWHPVRLQALNLQPKVFRKGRGRGRHPLQEEVVTLTEGVWKISRFSRLLQDVCSVFFRNLYCTRRWLQWRVVMAEAVTLPRSLSLCLCRDCIWMPVFVLLRVSECVHAHVCGLPPTSQIKGWKLRPGHLNAGHPGCPAGLGNEMQILPLTRGQNQRFAKTGHTMLCFLDVSKQPLSWNKNKCCWLHYSECVYYIPQPSKPDVKNKRWSQIRWFMCSIIGINP